jgi:protein disulfide-isomerase
MKFTQLYLFLLILVLVSPTTEVLGKAAWLNDFSKAQAQAQTEGKFVLVNFTGSDWCGWCIRLRKEVFLRPEFENYAASNLVLLEIDFPKRKPLPPLVQQSNQKLAEQFQVQGYPTLIVLDSQGRKLGRISYGTGGPKQFIAEVERLVRPPTERPPAKAPPRKAEELRRPARLPVTVASSTTELKLQSIQGSKQQRRAVINDRAFSAGQIMSIKLPAGVVKVHCLEIRERSVIVTVNGQRSKQELRLAAGT